MVETASPLPIAVRLVVILVRLLPLTLSVIRDRRRWLFAGGPVRRTPAFHEQRAEAMVDDLARLGPTFVKLAQLFAGRTDLIPDPYVSALGRLMDQVPPVPAAAIRRVLIESYGMPPEELFEQFDVTPLAAASLGQVHRARYGGEDVVVKVLRPGVEELVAKDVAAADRILSFIERRWPSPHTRGLRGIVLEFARRVGDEMDFRLEAEHAREVRRNFAGNAHVAVPRVIDGLVRQRALVLEFMEGGRIDRWMLEASAAGDAPRAAETLRRVIEIYMRMMLVDGLFHADPHPGNLFVAPDGAVVILDFGMVVRVPREQRWHLVQTVYASIKRDPDGVIAGFHALGLVEPSASPGKIRELVMTLLDLADRYTTAPERVELLANEVMSTLYDWPVVLPPDMVYFARTAALIEGLGVRVDPRFNAIVFATPVALRMRAEIVASLRDDAAALGQPDPIGGALGAFLGSPIGQAVGAVAERVLGAERLARLPELVLAVRRGAARHAPTRSPSNGGASSTDPLISAAGLFGAVLGSATSLARAGLAAASDALPPIGDARTPPPADRRQRALPPVVVIDPRSESEPTS